MNQNNVKIRHQALINSIKIGAKVGLLGPGPVLFGGMLGFGAMGQGSGLSIWHTTAISFFMEFHMSCFCRYFQYHHLISELTPQSDVEGNASARRK